MYYLKESICNCGSNAVQPLAPDSIDACADCGRILEGQIKPDMILRECDYCDNELTTPLEIKKGLCTSCYVYKKTN